jgi:hypothetical protein
MGRRQRSKRDGHSIGAVRTATAGAGAVARPDVRAALVEVAGVHRELVEVEAALRSAVVEARRLRASWREIGEALDVSAQGAQQRFGYRRGRETARPEASEAGQ